MRARRRAAAEKDVESGEAAIVRVEAEHSCTRAQEMKAEDFNNLRPVVHLVLDAPVMLTSNWLWGVQTVPLGLMKGARGGVKAIVFREGESPANGDQPAYVVVDFPDYRGQPLFEGAGKETWVPVPPVRHAVEGKECIWRKQLPLRLCWAVTLLKAQGLTVKEGVVVDLSSDGSQNWAAILGVPFVGWTRTESFDKWACRKLPDIGEFVKVRKECKVFKAREAFEAWADEQHEATMRTFGWQPKDDVQRHIAECAGLQCSKGAALSAEDAQDLRAMMVRRGIQPMAPCTMEKLAKQYTKDSGATLDAVFRAMGGSKGAKGVSGKVLSSEGPAAKRPLDSALPPPDGKRPRKGGEEPPKNERKRGLPGNVSGQEPPAKAPREAPAPGKRADPAPGANASLCTADGRPVVRPRPPGAPPRAQIEWGISNFGDTCYFAAVMQALASCPALLAALALAEQAPLLEATAPLLKILRPAPRAPATFMTRSDRFNLPWNVAARKCLAVATRKRPQFRANGAQQDAAEFLTFVLGELAAKMGAASKT